MTETEALRKRIKEAWRKRIKDLTEHNQSLWNELDRNERTITGLKNDLKKVTKYLTNPDIMVYS